ncbi:hypothetical protein LJR230_001920 [Trinickia sp. LjRoot230]|uniref:hypothetical protein n=1 Tax=Trinickia sp. LjRoot230 TaxID=3342288 RepID=UPI003ECF96DE
MGTDKAVSSNVIAARFVGHLHIPDTVRRNTLFGAQPSAMTSPIEGAGSAARSNPTPEIPEVEARPPEPAQRPKPTGPLSGIADLRRDATPRVRLGGSPESASEPQEPDGLAGAASQFVGAALAEPRRMWKMWPEVTSMLPLLPPTERDRVIDAAIGIESKNEKAAAIAHLACGVSCLTETQRGRLIDAVVSVDMVYSPTPFAELVRRAYALSETQRGRLVDHARKVHFTFIRAGALSILASNMVMFSKPHRAQIVDAVLDIDDDEQAKADGIAGLGPHLAELDIKQHERIVTATTGLQNHWAKGTAIAGLTPGLPALSKELRGLLVDAAVDLHDQEGSARAIAALGDEMALLDEAQRERLVDAAGGMTDKRKMAAALKGLADGAPVMSKETLARVVKLATQLPDDELKAQVLARLIANTPQAE